MINRRISNRGKVCAGFAALAMLSTVALAENTPSDLEAMARKAQDPLADVRAVMTDNTIAFKGGDDDTSFSFQIQPVYSIANETSVNMIFRAVVPILGIEPGVDTPITGPGPRADGSTWGLGDSLVQFFFSPKTDGGLKWGLGPQVSLDTSTNDGLSGPSWGAGLAGVLFGGSKNWSYGAVAMQHWGNSGDFSLLTIQPIVLYNFINRTGAYIGYNNSIAVDWKATSDNKVTLPVGVTYGQTLLLKNGDGLDLSGGFYGLAIRPDQGSKWQIKFGISYFFN